MSNRQTVDFGQSVENAIHELKHYLPSQSPIKDFIHHNSLHAFQDQKFFQGIFDARNIFGYNVTLNIEEFRALYASGRIQHSILEKQIENTKGKENVQLWLNKMLNSDFNFEQAYNIGKTKTIWKKNYKIDLDNKVHPLLFRVICAYLDQGVSIWNFPTNDNSFIENLRYLEINSFTSFFKTKRAKQLLENTSTTINDLLQIIVGDEQLYFTYLFDQQFAHRGWSGMVASIEHNPSSLLLGKKISLVDFIHFELLLEIDALDHQFGTDWKPIKYAIGEEGLTSIFEKKIISESDEILMIFQEAFEWSYYDPILFGLKNAKKSIANTNNNFQAVFCIDERECSIRRHIEKTGYPCETFGAPGFFGVEFFFQPAGGFYYEKLCPAPITPKYLIKEEDHTKHIEHSFLYNKLAHTYFGASLFSFAGGFVAFFELFKNLLFPSKAPAISDAFGHVGQLSNLHIEYQDIYPSEKGLQLGFTIEEMTIRVANQLKNIGLVQNFAPIIYMIAHGSSSANNPHHGAHDCGACSGRPGSVNARVFSFMANHPKVREALKEKGINIPTSTQFIGGLHDTAADQIMFYDIDVLSQQNALLHEQYSLQFEQALDLNAKERSRRFASIKTDMPIKDIRKEIQERSVSLFEPRPELGHGSNALCIIGRRSLSKNIFLDRRAFLNSYDYTTDPNGELLVNVISPIGPVCGGINLEYYFSRIDNHKLGAGTKLPHNVMGLIGVANSSDGDLRPGLPLQMIEVHDPIRLLVIVEHMPEIVHKVISSNAGIYDWYAKEWIHLVVLNPVDNNLYYFRNEKFEIYNPLFVDIQTAKHMGTIFENATQMSAFEIDDATKENLPIYYLND